MLYWIIYLIDIITPLKEVFIFLSICGGVLATFVYLSKLDCAQVYGEDCKDYRNIIKSFKQALFTTAIFGLLAILIPTKTTAYTLLGIKLGQTTISKPEVQQKVDKLSKIIDIKLDKYIQETEDKK